MIKIFPNRPLPFSILLWASGAFSNGYSESIIDFIYLVTHIRAKTTGGYHSFILTECDCGHKNINIEIEDILENIAIKNENNVKDIYNITDNLLLDRI